MSFAGQVVLITGVGGGIGTVLAEVLADEGAVVAGADVKPLPGGRLDSFHPLDVTDEAACRAVVRDVVGKYGRLDVLIHAAGVLGQTSDPLATSTTEFNRIMAINAAGTFSMVRECGLVMREVGLGGSMVVFSSVAAKEARRDYLPYNASKLAVLNIVWSMAELLAPYGISVNAVAPGPVNTAMWEAKALAAGADLAGAAAAKAKRAAELPMGRFAEPDEVARAVLFLAAPHNRYITGVSLDVAGGAHLGMGT